MIRDADTVVVANCLVALNEIMRDEGGIAINQNIVYHLLNRIKQFNEWGQCIVLDLLARYRPADEEETFNIMNLLDATLRVSNSAVVLGATKCFLRYTEGMHAIKKQVYERLKSPLLTLMASPVQESKYTVLAHVNVLAQRCPGVFDDRFKQFFCLYNELAMSVRESGRMVSSLLNISGIGGFSQGYIGFVCNGTQAVLQDFKSDGIRFISHGVNPLQYFLRHPPGIDL